MLLGGLSAGALTSCAPRVEGEPRITSDSVYANNHFVEGAGYYHAPFQGFYPKPYNSYDATRRHYDSGGQWGDAPYQSIVNVSSPTELAALSAQTARAAVVRAGFGSTGGRYHSWS